MATSPAPSPAPPAARPTRRAPARSAAPPPPGRRRAPDVRFRGSLGGTLVGIDAFRDYVEQVRTAFPDWHNEIDELISAGDAVVARLTFAGTHRGELLGFARTGRRVAYAGVAIFHLSGGRIASAWIVGDTQELWRALGATPPAG